MPVIPPDVSNRRYSDISILILLAILALSGLGTAQSYWTTVAQMSGETIFLNAGSSSGVQVGDTITISHERREIGTMVVSHVSERFASGRLVAGGPVSPGQDAAFRGRRAEADLPTGREFPEPAVEGEREQQKPRDPAGLRKPRSRLTGSVSLQAYAVNDQGTGNLDLLQPTLRLNIRARNLGGRQLHFHARTRTRYYQRSYEFGADVPETDFSNRVYELSLIYDDPSARLNFRVGRIISNFISGVGYVDGLQAHMNFNHHLRAGGFAGTQPDWRTSAFQTTIRKVGAFAGVELGTPGTRTLESTIALAGEYHSTTVSREYLYLQNNITLGNKLFLHQSLEVDINRDWREEMAGEKISLSQLYFSARVRATRSVSVGMAFDNRRNYWTYEMLSYAEFLFDEALRTGLRGNVTVRLPGNLTLLSSAGFNKRETDSKPTVSYSANLLATRFSPANLTVGIRGASFSGPVTSGYTLSGRISRAFAGDLRVEVSGGDYAYWFAGSSGRTHTPHAAANIYVPLMRRFYVVAEFGQDFGDAIRSQRFLAELGYRL